MRSQSDIVERLEARIKNDPLGFEITEYIFSMDFDHAKPYLKDGVTDWKAETKEETFAKAKKYMSFAIGKAEDERGISANRSIQHYIAWLWLLEEDALLEKVEHEYDTNYHDYGIDILRMIEKHFRWGKEPGA
jgi:hypothetical protein